jgi:transposase
MSPLTATEVEARDTVDRCPKDVRVRTRVPIILPAGEQGMRAVEIARRVRCGDHSVRHWVKWWTAQGMDGLNDRPMPVRLATVTKAGKEQRVLAVRQRPRSPPRCGPLNAWPLPWLSRQGFACLLKRCVGFWLKEGSCSPAHRTR